jgi:hypothetical protein
MKAQLPPFSVSRIFANTDEELNSGRQHQSIEPVSDISAALLQFPITP